MRDEKKELIFVTGTDTGVGKTFVTVQLIMKDFENGVVVGGIKPIETGLENFKDYKGSDSLEYAKIMNTEVNNVNTYFFNKPYAPLTASKYDRIDIDIKRIIAFIEEKIEKFEKMYVEGAGGLMVPFAEDYTFLDLIKYFSSKAKVIIVAKNSLGTINHTLMTVEILKSKGIKIEGIVLNNIENTKDISFMKDNKEMIEKLSGVKVMLELEYYQK